MTSHGVPRPIRAIIGVVALLLLLFVVNGWLREYRSGPDDGSASVETTATPEGEEGGEGGEEAPANDDDASEPTEDTEETGSATVVVIIEGLNFRRTAAADGELIRGLGRNDRLTHLETVDGWYHVRDGAGVEGYVSANPQYTELRE